MPTYTFRNKLTNEEFDTVLTISGREQFLKENPNLEQLIVSVNIGDPMRLGKTKIHSGLKDKYKSLDRFYKGNKINF